ncbi:MAG: hypothetical protein ABSD29_02225 [Verrucomicrobiota bacterium]
MRAAVLHGKKYIRVENVAPPPLQTGEARIQSAWPMLFRSMASGNRSVKTLVRVHE